MPAPFGPLWRRILLGAAILVALLLTAFAAFPWGWLAPTAARIASSATGRRIMIAHATREDLMSLHPFVVLEGVTIGEPAGFAGPPMAQIARVKLSFAALPILIGEFRPSTVEMQGAMIRLQRRADGRNNWDLEGGPKPASRNSRPAPALSIRDSRIELADTRRHITLAAALLADATGFSIRGTGLHRGQPLTIHVSGGAISAATLAAPYPMRVAIASPLAALAGTVRMDHALDLSYFSANLSARAQDLSYLDDIIQAGLFPTRPLTLTGQIRHEGQAWIIERINTQIGRSRLMVTGTVDKQDGRTKLNGKIAAATLDFDDFSSVAQRARAEARRQVTGPRVIPATRIDLTKLGKLDGRIDLDATQLLSSGPSAFRTLKATISLDHRQLEVFPLTADLRSGHITGRATVDHRAGAPKLTLDLRIAGADIEKLFFPGDVITGPLAARIRLNGPGETVRDALAVADGKVGFVMAHGSVRRDYAIFAGGDIFKAIGAIVGPHAGKRVALQCLIGDFHATGGTLSPAPFFVETPVSRTDASGRISLMTEQLDLALAGRSKQPGPLQSTTPVRLFGSLSDPKLDIRPPRAASVGKNGLLPRLGALVKGIKTRDEVAAAPDISAINCSALSAAALR